MDSTKATIQYIVQPPTNEEELEERLAHKKLKDVADFIHANPGCSRRAVTDGVKGSKDAMGGRLQEMLKLGVIENRGSETNFILYLTDAGKAEFDLFDATITQIGGA